MRVLRSVLDLNSKSQFVFSELFSYFYFSVKWSDFFKLKYREVIPKIGFLGMFLKSMFCQLKFSLASGYINSENVESLRITKNEKFASGRADSVGVLDSLCAWI